MDGDRSGDAPIDSWARTSRRAFLSRIGTATAAAAVGANAVDLPSAPWLSAASAPVDGNSGATPPAAASATAPTSPFSLHALPRGGANVLDHLTLDTFTRQLDTEFRIESDTARVPVKLIEATASTPDTALAQDCFSVVFHGPADRPLEQGTYPLEHTALGRFDLFVVPVGHDEQGYYYEAVFNRRPPGRWGYRPPAPAG
jgi:hypothetical protein